MASIDRGFKEKEFSKHTIGLLKEKIMNENSDNLKADAMQGELIPVQQL